MRFKTKAILYLFVCIMGIYGFSFNKVEAAEQQAVSNASSYEKSYVSVKDYGAVGNGYIDDSNAIRKAGAVALAEGRTLYFPNGNYYCSTNLFIDSNCVMKGESRENTFLTFRDSMKSTDNYSWFQRGIVTFRGESLSVENITFRYTANKSTTYTRKMGQSGVEGVLFSILKANSVTVKNCGFYVGGQQKPSITCMWLKPEQYNISNVNIDGCKFVNDTESTVGGCLWLSDHDSAEMSLSDITVSNCTFLKNGNDEILSVWGYNVSNININNNSFEYYGNNVQNDVFISFGMPNENKVEHLKSVYFTDNKVKINGLALNMIKVQKLADDSDIHISKTEVTGTVKSGVWFTCFGFNKASNVYLENNNISLNGGAVISYINYFGGNIAVNGDYFTTSNCTRSMIIKSPDSQYFAGANVKIVGGVFTFGDLNTVSEQSTIQFPASGEFRMEGCTVDTTASKIHEFKYQLLTRADNGFYKHNIVIKDCSIDGAMFFKFHKYSDAYVNLSGTKCKSLNFLFPNSVKCLNYLNLSGAVYERLSLNYKAIDSTLLNTYCVKVVPTTTVSY